MPWSEKVGRQERFWLGVDGGGTNTRAVLIDEAGAVRGEGRAEAANFLRVGLEAAVGNIRRAFEAALSEAGASRAQVVEACIGLAGVSHPKHRQQMHEALSAALGIGSMTIETDARVALAGATDLAPGVVIIAGTGSIAYGMNARGEFARAGGWGPAMGDEGSGYYIGRRALEAVVSAFDHRGPQTSLVEPVYAHFGVASAPELPPVIYESPVKVMREIAQLSRIVVAEARRGDAVARDILTTAAMELGRAVTAVISRLGMEEESFRVAYVGGVFEAGEMVLAPLRGAINVLARRALLAPPLFPPVLGAAQLAQSNHIERRELVS